jgi:hypothetical protein
MQTSPQTNTAFVPARADESQYPRRAEDRVYQGVTIAVMLLLLVSLWVF